MRKCLLAVVVVVAACGSRRPTTTDIVVPPSSPLTAPSVLPFAAPQRPSADGPAVKKLVSSPGHSCVLLGSGEVACWGGSIGPIVDSYRTDILKPTIAPHVRDAIDVATGNEHACAVRRSGEVVCWIGGDGIPGVDVKVIFEGASVTIPGIDDAVEIASRSLHTCVRRRDGRVACFGKNDHGELGAPPGQHATPKVVDVPGVTDAVEIATGYNVSCARRAHGNVVCWGEHTDGAVVEVAGSADATALFAENSSICFVRENGDAVVQGLLHQKYILQNPSPPVVVAKEVTRVASTGSATCAVRRDGSVVCSGQNLQGELGDGTTKDRQAMAPVIGLPKAKAISASWNHFCAHTIDDAVRCWGANESGQLGIGTNDKVRTPVALPGAGPSARVALGYGTTAAVENGRLRMWGHDLLASQFITPLDGNAVPGIPEVRAAALGMWHGCVITKAGGVSCWGTPSSLGVRLPYKDVRDVKPIANVKSAIDIAAADSLTCAVRRDGKVLCWGSGPGLGAPKIDITSDAIEVPGISDAVEVKLADNYACVRRKKGDVRCWGHTAQQDYPGLDAVAIGVGAGFGCAVQKNGGVACWTYAGVSPVPGVRDAVAIGVGGARACIVRRGGTVACFERQKRELVELEGIANVTSIAVGSEHACALTPSGPRCWGRNSGGQLPVALAYSAKPVPIVW